MEVVIFLYDGMTALDAIGPYEVFNACPGVNVRFVAKEAGVKKTDSGIPLLYASSSISDVTSADILCIPGARPPHHRGPAEDPDVLDWIRRIHPTTKWTTSVCTGGVILGATGLLDGLNATTHWACYDELAAFGAKPTAQRVVREGKIVTAAGVSAGIDFALTLAALEFGDQTAMAIQLAIEYDPQPPFDTGSPLKAPQALIDAVRGMLD